MQPSRDLPIAYLAGLDAPVQPGHPVELARLGVTGIRGGTRHVTNEVRYDSRTMALVHRPGWDGADPRSALADLMWRAAVARFQPFEDALEACASEQDPDNHEFGPAALRVDGVEHEAVEVREHGLVARAAVVDGWTVVASVPEGGELAVELHTVAELAAT